MSAITDFYQGFGTDDKGRSLDDYLLFSDEQLESVHDYIQWMFPNTEVSRFNIDAPLLTDADIELFMNDIPMMNNVTLACARMTKFYKFSNIYVDAERQWVTQGNHNFLRLTRMLKFLRSINKNYEAESLFVMLARVYSDNSFVVGKDTLRYWLDAAES